MSWTPAKDDKFDVALVDFCIVGGVSTILQGQQNGEFWFIKVTGQTQN